MKDAILSGIFGGMAWFVATLITGQVRDGQLHFGAAAVGGVAFGLFFCGMSQWLKSRNSNSDPPASNEQ